MTDEELAAIRARVDAATPGPWRWADWEKMSEDEPDDLTRNATLERDDPDEVVLDVLPYDGRSPWLEDGLADTFVRYRPNAAFIAHAREDVPALLAEVERLRAALTHIIERYEQTQAGSHGDEALLPLDHWNLPRAMQQEARDALGLPAMSEETTR